MTHGSAKATSLHSNSSSRKWSRVILLKTWQKRHPMSLLSDATLLMDALGFSLCRMMMSFLGVCSCWSVQWLRALKGLSTPFWWSYNFLYFQNWASWDYFIFPPELPAWLHTLNFSLRWRCDGALPKVSCWLSGKICVVIGWRHKQETCRCQSFSKHWDNHSKQA